ncbi:hypothetical protein [Robertkochia solimangrovi]|uniref:hypothetical protein n=1 Tax=Robertkochia solimangrovi TaxID=2213046 RepID=UPI00117E4797|nr:hypothetical protein [Robertkochia solimangrovi]TRZ43704.1 hypothetical protein DMZ48_09855 [Robertkochia solimangrovi]
MKAIKLKWVITTMLLSLFIVSCSSSDDDVATFQGPTPRTVDPGMSIPVSMEFISNQTAITDMGACEEGSLYITHEGEGSSDEIGTFKINYTFCAAPKKFGVHNFEAVITDASGDNIFLRSANLFEEDELLLEAEIDEDDQDVPEGDEPELANKVIIDGGTGAYKGLKGELTYKFPPIATQSVLEVKLNGKMEINEAVEL